MHVIFTEDGCSSIIIVSNLLYIRRGSSKFDLGSILDSEAAFEEGEGDNFILSSYLTKQAVSGSVGC
jgi:hypothetical protein